MKLGDAEGFWGWCQAAALASPPPPSYSLGGQVGVGAAGTPLQCHCSPRGGSCRPPFPRPRSFPPGHLLLALRPQPAPHPQQSLPHSPHPRAASRTGPGPCPLSADQQLSRPGASPGTPSLATGRNMMPGSEDLAFLVLPGSLARPQAESSSLPWLTDSCKPSLCLLILCGGCSRPGMGLASRCGPGWHTGPAGSVSAAAFDAPGWKTSP